ncbi:MAG TPA: phosphatase PAP2 family protein [Thermoanaerobaculia bacterium]
MASPSDAPFAKRLRSLRPFPHEWVILAYLAVSFWLLEHMPVTYPRTALLLAYARPVFLIALVAALVVLLRLRFGKEPREPLADTAFAIGRICLLLMVAWATHFLLKSFVFVINPRTWDLQLAVWDQRIHLGFSPSAFFTALFRARLFLNVLDLFYSGFYYFIVIGYAGALLGLLPQRLRFAFGAAFTLTWVVGSVLYVAFPSWGPVYVFSSEFVETLRYMPITVSVQRVLYEEISSLVRNPEALRYVKFGSVAAFPSLHVAVVTLYAAASRRVSRRWFHANILLVVAMVLGSVITGYHYLIDAWAGIILALGLWWACAWWFERGEERDTP